MPVIACACGKSYRIQPGLAGKTFRCKACNSKLRVPADDTPEPAAVAATARTVLPQQIDKTLIGNQNTVAGNPALMKVSMIRYLKCRPALPLFALVVSLGFAGWMFYKFHSPAVAGGAVAVGLGFMYQAEYVKIKRKFHSGNLCAALVISTSPYRVAVFANLANDGRGPKLAVAVREQPLENMFPAAPTKGTRLVAVCFYRGTVGTGAWEDFSPTIANTACTTQKQLDRAMASLDLEDFQALKLLTPKLKPDRSALYKLWEMPELEAMLSQ